MNAEGVHTWPMREIVNGQGVKATEAGEPRGLDAPAAMDAGKKINGRKRHALVDRMDGPRTRTASGEHPEHDLLVWKWF